MKLPAGIVAVGVFYGLIVLVGIAVIIHNIAGGCHP